MPAMKAKTPPTRRGFHFAQFKALDAEHGTFEGYLAVFSNEDQGGDIIEPGAFSKTLVELKSHASTRNAHYLLPIFWGHDPNDPIGGFTDAKEDSHGLYVRGEIDLDIEQGRRAYSGMQKGYCDGMSIGYFTIKYDYDRTGRRHLKELSVFEGSITPVPMNNQAVIVEVKSATGKATWPLGERDAAWDNGAAHKRIVAWATDSDGNVDTGKLKSVHFYSPDDSADAEDVSKYKLGFCDVIDGEVKAMPKGIFACAGSHGVDAATGISADDKASIKGKISAYYVRMSKEFDDDSIVAPWDAKEKGNSMPRRERPANVNGVKARDFSTHFQALAQSDQLQDDWADTFLAIVRCFSDLMWQAQAQANGWIPEGSDPVDIPQAAQDNLDAFASAVNDLVARSIAADFVPSLDDDADSFYDPDEDDECGYMALDTRRAGRKAGRTMSTANHKEMGGMLTAMKKAMNDMAAQHKALTAFHAKMGGDTEPGAGNSDTTQNSDTAGKDGKDGKSIDTQTQGAGLPESNTTPLTATEVSALIRARMQASALAQRVGNQ